jgi:LysR family glycine cleavage system transcriptional activator
VRRLPPFTAIEAFVQVARLGSVKAAAAELALSPPALSRRIQTLERFLSRTLFDRAHHAMRLTADGEALLQRLAPALDMLWDAIEDDRADGELMRLRLNVLPLFAAQRLVPALPSLRERHANLHIDIETAGQGLTRLGDGIDAAIVLSREIDPSLYARRLDSNRVLAIAGRDMVEGPDPIRRPADLARRTILIHRDMPDLFDYWLDAVGEGDLRPVAIDHFDSGPLILDAVAGGLGVAFMLDHHFEDAHDQRLVPLFEDLEIASPYNYWFACRRSAMSRRPVKLFHDWLVDTIAEV